MARCARTNDLQVHHKRRAGGNDLDNAQVLCKPCHEATATFSTPGNPPHHFLMQPKMPPLSEPETSVNASGSDPATKCYETAGPGCPNPASFCG